MSNSEVDGRRIYTVPGMLTSLIGREEERQRVVALITLPEARLVTLTGPGGIGKTRLALSVAHDLQEAFAHGACFVDLTTTRTTGQVLHTIAQSLGREAGQRPLIELLLTFLQDKSLLLVLDNFEQVLGAASELTHLLMACPGLTLLVTSREILRINAEHVFPVAPLTLPSAKQASEAEAGLVASPAVALFVERARQSRPDFQLNSSNAQVVAEICTRLEGLPLALELAAARVKVLSPQALLARLSHRLQILSGGPRDAPARLQAVRNTVQWSYDLLTASEQLLFRRLCLFIGGCTLAAIQAIYQNLGDDPTMVSKQVSSLLDKSLIQQSGGEDGRFSLLETVREFGLECLEQYGERERVQQAHTRYYLDWSEAARCGLWGKGPLEQRLWLQRFVLEQANLHTVMQRVIERHSHASALQLGAALGPFWVFLGQLNLQIYQREGKSFLEQALRASETIQTSARAWSLSIYGNLQSLLGEMARGETTCQEGLRLCQQLEDIQGSIGTIWLLWDIIMNRCDYREARKIAEKAVAYARQHGHGCTIWGGTWTLAHSLQRLGHTAMWQGDYEDARAFLVEAIALATEARDPYVVGRSRFFLGKIAYLEGKQQEARIVLEQSRESCKELGLKIALVETQSFLGRLLLDAQQVEEASILLLESLRQIEEAEDVRQMARLRVCLARVELARHHHQEARQMLEESLKLSVTGSDWMGIAEGLEVSGIVIAEQGEAEWATRLWSRAALLREKMGAPMPPVEQIAYDLHVQQVYARLSEADFWIIWEQERAMGSVFSTVPLTLDVVVSANPVPVAQKVSTRAGASIVTRRELDVLRALARGLTNAQIAADLGISRATVNSHLRSLYNKLNVSSRTAAMRYAFDRNLLQPSAIPNHEE